ncbi:hypothetical protein [Mycolicibacterium frederiksbergense]|uniref:hypothetical protein n=1 Tax=Mycolicibacterium frederiksbergense TaxID=117567 RepID=UPI00265BBA52|nr:hypothetical protein [Mycolicibacterium frederiksbergense]MBX9919276.1 hypothetical protein [Mycolicibacterium frederiksbergense]MDO0975994.1 hypothetical protein [Mycolicibacterium frederiksbergense]
MPTRTLGVALWEYRDDTGRRRRAYYRETFELPESEVERGERAQVFEAQDDYPSSKATNRSLIEWLVTRRGADHDEIKSLTKPELWLLVQAPEDVAKQQDSSEQ